MPTKPRKKLYAAGRRAEYEARDLLLSEGWPVVVRAAGSKGAADLVAVRGDAFAEVCAPDLTQTLFVSVKSGTGRATKAERAKLAELPGRKELWTRERGGVWVREKVA